MYQHFYLIPQVSHSKLLAGIIIPGLHNLFFAIALQYRLPQSLVPGYTPNQDCQPLIPT